MVSTCCQVSLVIIKPLYRNYGMDWDNNQPKMKYRDWYIHVGKILWVKLWIGGAFTGNNVATWWNYNGQQYWKLSHILKVGINFSSRDRWKQVKLKAILEKINSINLNYSYLMKYYLIIKYRFVLTRDSVAMHHSGSKYVCSYILVYMCLPVF